MRLRDRLKASFVNRSKHIGIALAIRNRKPIFKGVSESRFVAG
jgi:hypothetical protein